MQTLSALLELSSAGHRHLCPRMVLGVRMGMCAAGVLGLDLPQVDKRLFTFMETYGCALDGVSAASGCRVGSRTMQVLDFGKIAATFIDTHTDQAVRIYPQPEVRKRVTSSWDGTRSRWHAYLDAYQGLPDEVLLQVIPVRLTLPIQKIISREDARASCEACGEEIFNQREMLLHDKILCRACAGQSYYSYLQECDLHSGMLAPVSTT